MVTLNRYKKIKYGTKETIKNEYINRILHRDTVCEVRYGGKDCRDRSRI